MADTFMGRLLYDIPTCHISVRRVHLTQEERVIYNVVEIHFRQTIKNILKRKQIEPSRFPLKEIYLKLLLRLRQAVAHPFLLEHLFKKTLKREHLQKINKGLSEVRGQEPAFKRIGKWCARHGAVLNDDTARNHEIKQNAFGKSQFGYEFDMKEQMGIALASKSKKLCRLCYQKPPNPYVAKCKHIFCKGCLDNYLQAGLQDGRHMAPKCPDCDKRLRDCFDEHSDMKSFMRKTPLRSVTSKARIQGCDSLEQHPNLRKSQCKFLHKSDQDYPKPVVPSAKTVAVKEAIIEWQLEAPDDKIIVFTEFKMTGAILGRMLRAEGIQFLYFFGDMSQVAKQNTIQKFHDTKDIKVMACTMNMNHTK
ncbi:putative related to protein RIS1 [Rosellinia necatrix]|uniref:Putative related to protein RIS1 n=1 Tax=Rosellinia necatrix TaxID=77044 RepID=A0A1S8A4Q8_ROSNE|nr:putative related to protein RIS1 [Rosellinia necatrix]